MLFRGGPRGGEVAQGELEWVFAGVLTLEWVFAGVLTLAFWGPKSEGKIRGGRRSVFAAPLLTLRNPTPLLFTGRPS